MTGAQNIIAEAVQIMAGQALCVITHVDPVRMSDYCLFIIGWEASYGIHPDFEPYKPDETLEFMRNIKVLNLSEVLAAHDL